MCLCNDCSDFNFFLTDKNGDQVLDAMEIEALFYGEVREHGVYTHARTHAHIKSVMWEVLLLVIV